MSQDPERARGAYVLLDDEPSPPDVTVGDWFWPDLLLAATVLVGLLTVAWCIRQAVTSW